MREIGAAEAKTHFLAILKDVEAKREQIVVTKNGRPVARVMPMPIIEDDPIFGFYRGKLEIIGDVMSPLYTEEEYEEFFKESAARLK